ncbi:leucine-rich repeat domain-containing protein [Frisingicoccus sp.]|uniref:leucine-rich repeat domain-containing protein n=1 Tax=Frisingicoccus sp. TaxID=1918627 RepID=UPI003AB55BD5
MKIKRILAAALSVSMLMGQGAYASETSMNMETIPENVSETVEESLPESAAETTAETIAESISESQSESLEETDEIKETESEALETIAETVVETAEETESEQEIMPEVSAAQVEISAANFPDKNFRQYILDTIDKDSNKKLSEEEINSTTVISVPDMGIQSLKGIELFTALKTLDGRNNQLTSADLSSNTMLSSVDLSGNVYDLGVIGGIYPVSELPDGFNVSKASEWTGAQCDGDSLKNIIGVHWKANIGYTYNLGNGHTAVFSFNCTLNAPENAIEFKDGNLLRELSKSCDSNKDGFITKEELGSETILLLYGAGIEDISGLEYAVNLTELNLSGNAKLKNINALANLANLENLSLGSTSVSDIDALSGLTNLKQLNLAGTSVSDMEVLANFTNLRELSLNNTSVSDISVLLKLPYLKRLVLDNTQVSDIEVLKGLSSLERVSLNRALITDEQCMELLGFRDDIKMFVGDSTHIGRNLIIDNFNPKVTITEGSEKISYNSYFREITAKASGTARIHVSYNSIEKDIAVTIQEIDADPLVSDDKDIDIQYTPMNTSYITTNDEAVILDSNGQLWSLYPKTEKIQGNVKEYVSQWVYDHIECEHYSYVIDKNDSLWMDGIKKLDHVQKVDFPYALDDNNVLHNLYKEETIDGVKDWAVSKNMSGTMIREDSSIYLLKQDGTLWEKYQEKFIQVDSEVSQLGEYGYYVKKDGTYKTAWGNLIAENVSGVNRKIGGYYDKDGNFYLDGINLGKMDIQDKVRFQDEKSNIFTYYLTVDGKVYCYNESTKKIDYVDDNVSSLASADAYLKLNGDYLYRLKDGTYIKTDGTPLEEGKVKTVRNYAIYLTKNSEYEVRKDETLRLTKIKDIWFNAGRYFALRTDGTIWDITSNPEKVFESETNIPVTGVALNKNALTFTEKGQSNTLRATVSPADATEQSLTWSSSNEKVAKVNNSGVVTPVANGTAVITVKTKDGGKTATCKVTVKFPTVATLTNLRAVTGGPSKVKLTWNAVSGAEGYLVYAQKNGQYGYVGMTTKGTTYTDTKALTDDYNFYWVFPFVKDTRGNMYTGGCQSYKYAKGGVCPAVTNLKAVSEIGQVRLTWKASAGAEGYLVYGKTATGKYGYKGMTTKGTTYVHKSASKTEYNFYWVFPYHKDANGKMIVGGTPKYVYGKAK